MTGNPEFKPGKARRSELGFGDSTPRYLRVYGDNAIVAGSETGSSDLHTRGSNLTVCFVVLEDTPDLIPVTRKTYSRAVGSQ